MAVGHWGSGWLIALIIGTILGIMRTLPNKTARAIGTAYVSFFVTFRY